MALTHLIMYHIYAWPKITNILYQILLILFDVNVFLTWYWSININFTKN